MPRVPSVSPATGNPTSSSFIHTACANFVDNNGRTLLLRGVNLSGSSKAPVDRPSQVLRGFWDDAESGGGSFVGRPLDLEDGSADIHLARLRGWGFNMLRFPVVWEALEHEGPGKYDEEFLDYIVRVLQKCKDYGFKVYIDPHQDIWSRFSGGSGAPYWTLAACGINPRNFTATQTSIVHCEYPLAHDPNPASLPAMIWSTNYGKLAAQTIFTLFFAGRDFAPNCIIDNQNIQDYLQSHFISAFAKLAERIQQEGGLLDECVIGWDSLNEPFEGLCGWEDLNTNPTKQGSTLKKGTYPTPAQSLRLGMGQPQTVDNWQFGALGPRRDGSVTIDPKGRTIWASPDTEKDGIHPKWGWRRDPRWKLGTCIWAQHGVWDIESGYILTPDYFNANEAGQEVEFIEDYWRPHWQVFAKRIREFHPEAIMFVQPPVFARPPPLQENELLGRAAYSGHYYDGLTLITRHWNWFNADALGLLRGKYKSTLQAVKIGDTAIRKSLQEQLKMLKDDATILGPYPTVIGEIGTPFDMDQKRSYGWTDKGKYKGDYSNQTKALDASLNAGDGGNALSWTVWTYCPDSSHAWGDGWNMEDLSLWSSDDLRPNEKMGAVYGIPDDSNTRLLRSKLNFLGTSLGHSAATSSLSLATLPIVAAVAYDEQKILPITTMEGWGNNPYDFLTDGARAVRAFSRPWPTKVIGVPQCIKFDIRKALFKLVVRVSAEDKPRIPECDDEVGSAKETLATEIYVPLVHYAHQRYVGQGLGQITDEEALCQGEAQYAGSASSSLSTSLNTSCINLTTMVPGSDTSGTLTESGPPSPSSRVLDLIVTVSGGRWEVDGQLLKWWYPVPSEREKEKEYTIEIKRRGGPIKVSDVEAASADGWGWFRQQFCPSEPGCVVM